MNSAYMKIGLTGGIGAGKSTAAARFRALGALVLDADAISRAALEPGGACYEAVVHAFGADVLLPGGAIDRKALAKIVFASKEKRALLNGIVHPHVIETMFETAEAELGRRGGIAVFEVPLLFESGMHKKMDANVLICADEEARVERILRRDGATREAAQSRIRAQMPDEQKRLLADYVLENNGSVAELNEQIDRVYNTLLEELHEKNDRT